MSLTDTLNTMVTTVTGKALNRYRLDIPSCTADIDVEDFSGSEAMSELYSYTINFTSADKNIDARQMMSKPATLTMGAGNLLSLADRKVVHGVVTHFERTGGSADEAQYCIVLEPFLALLGNQFRTHRFFVNKSVPEVVAEVLTEHGLKGWEYEFTLKADYPKREQINQYQENDLAFIERLLAEVGIFYFFTLQPDTQTEVVHFADKQSAWTFGKKLPLNSPSGANDNAADSVWDVHVWHNVVERSVTASDYNHREAQNVLTSVPADMTRGDGEGNTYGDVYHYRPRHLERGDKITPTAETGNFWARLEHERYLSTQTTVTGSSTDHTLGPAQVLTITETAIPPTLPRETENGLVIISAGYSASRQNALKVEWAAMPYYENRCWRPAAKKRPVVSGTLTARVTSAKDNDIYAWQDASGMYRVKFDADRDDKRQGMESMPVRFAKPYGGDKYGFHFPLIQGTEVAIAFHEGDPDRPYIAHALHDSRHVDHVTELNSTRNVIRTAGLNKLRMEDKRGEEHIKLSTEYGGKTQLNLGYNVDASRELRGEGAELRTDDWVSIRGGKGIFISADNQPKAQGQMLDMNAAIAQLQGALQLVTALAQSSSASGAMEADTGSQQQLSNVLAQMKEAGLLASAPAGIGLVTPKNIQLSAGHTLTATAGENVDMGIMKKFTLAAGEAISLFAQRMGMSIFAARGKVDIQAQTDAMRLQSDKIMNINSVNGEIVLNAAQGITLTSKGGAYIKIKDGSVEIGAPGKIDLRSANILWGGSASLEQALSPMSVSDPEFHNPMNGGFQIQDQANGQPKPYIPYRIETADGQVIRGVTDENGCTQAHYGVDPKAIKLFFE
ncbi:type VI secretion system Vgr family protein [Klebsiella electrica]|uniref:type VI secretion system Vgr family protein n=1 Tax=Klebsiella electrica TaxID=1259973 RepID=UPI003F7643D8